jgi:hypothetical protein
MNVEIGAEAAQFPEKEYINEIAVAVLLLLYREQQLRPWLQPPLAYFLFCFGSFVFWTCYY